MLFNSFSFLFVFLPITYLGALLLLRAGRSTQAVGLIVICSLFFYGYWRPSHLWVIVASLGFNYVIGNLLDENKNRFQRKVILFIGVLFNLSLLGFFKYLDFFSDLFQATQSGDFFGIVVNTTLPIGISFYTFQQIAYLVDRYSNEGGPHYSIRDYAFFVTFFPQLIAGPIVSHSQIMPQLDHLATRVQSPTYVSRFFIPGISLLLVGLIKKILVADTFGNYSDQAFALSSMDNLTFLDAWGGATAYTMQIYFDFSGYSDMAIGMGLMFGLQLPLNFLSPYKAQSIIDFWRRWHITLSSFLKNYVYIALGGNRRGTTRRFLNLLITMALGGLWHGANLTFVFWGLAHGLLLIINHGFRYFCPWRTPAWIGVPVTFLCIVLTWVAFRAENFDSMISIYAVMFGARGIVVPWSYYSVLELFGPVVDLQYVRAGNIMYFGGIQQLMATILAMIVVFFAPSSMSILDETNKHKFVQSKYMPLGLGVLGTVALLVMWTQANVTFLYFQF